MTLLLIAIGALIVGGLVYFLRRSSNSGQVASAASSMANPVDWPVRTASDRVATPPAGPQPGTVRNVPPTLANLRILTPSELDSVRQNAMLTVLRGVPRPPQRMDQLISREFVTNATSAELSALVMAEPLMAAKVLATVNSPLYGLRTPVVSIGQAVTFLGFSTVRSIGLQYLLNASFKAASPELKSVFETLWASSALASELCAKLAQKLDLPDQGALATNMVLYFVGQLATYSLMPTKLAVNTARLGFMARLQAEQDLLGLGSAEIGGLLMQEWGLPPSIVDDVRDIDRVLVTPITAMEADRAPRLALCYLCARLGERLARGSLRDLAVFDLNTEPDLEVFHLRGILAVPELSKLPALLQSEDLLASVVLMQQAVCAPGFRA